VHIVHICDGRGRGNTAQGPAEGLVLGVARLVAAEEVVADQVDVALLVDLDVGEVLVFA